VGVDPLLRTSIWSHLLDLSAGSDGTGATLRTTIVITTHYIEEARQAHRVGMMRFGKLLAEGHPEDLLRRSAIPRKRNSQART
jgi:ABC-type multidrug transport system ATPase subunit